MNILTGNLYHPIPEQTDREFQQTLVQGKDCRIEKIVSFGQRSPEGYWYDQPQDEWVMLASGKAELQLTSEDGPVVALVPGDYLLIPAGLKHRIISTDPDNPTIWLAVHTDPFTSP